MQVKCKVIRPNAVLNIRLKEETKKTRTRQGRDQTANRKDKDKDKDMFLPPNCIVFIVCIV